MNADNEKIIEVVKDTLSKDESLIVVTREHTIMNGTLSEILSMVTFVLQKLYREESIDKETIEKVARLAVLDDSELKLEALNLAKEVLSKFKSE